MARFIGALACLLTASLFCSPAAAQPVTTGILERTELRRGSSTTLHVIFSNPDGETISIAKVMIIAGDFRHVSAGHIESFTLPPLASKRFFFELLADTSGESTVGITFDWKTKTGHGSVALPLAKARIGETRLFEYLEKFLGGAIALAILGFLGNFYLEWKRRNWDARAGASARRDELIRRMTEQVHGHIQKHYALIASWAFSFANEAEPVLNGASPLDENRVKYLCYLLAKLLNLEDTMEESVGGYFLRDQFAEATLAYLMDEIDKQLIRADCLDEEGYSAFVGSLGNLGLYISFKDYLNQDQRAKSAYERFARYIASMANLDFLYSRVHLKWVLIQLHIGLTYADWYPHPVRQRCTQRDLDTLRAVLNAMIADGEMQQSEADEYRGKVEGNVRVAP